MSWTGSFFNQKGVCCIFHHIPKCGGTSVLSALKKWFTVIREYRDGDAYPNLLKLEILTSEHCICGHYELDGYYLHQRYPEIFNKREHRVFTFVRDPLELKVSLHYYEKRRGTVNGRSLDETLLTRKNFLSARFPCTEDNYREVIDRYFFVGITEHAQESMDDLAYLLGKRRIQLGHENQSKRDSCYENLSPALIEKFKNENKLDYLIYNYCCKRRRLTL